MKQILFLTSGFLIGFSLASFAKGDFEQGCILLAIAVVALLLNLRKGEG